MTPVAVLGPVLAAMSVNVIVSPRLGFGSLTVLSITRSACGGVSVTLAVLLAVLGSNWSAAASVAVFVRGMGLSTVALIVKVCGVPGVTVPTVQTPVVEL